MYLVEKKWRQKVSGLESFSSCLAFFPAIKLCRHYFCKTFHVMEVVSTNTTAKHTTALLHTHNQWLWYEELAYVSAVLKNTPEKKHPALQLRWVTHSAAKPSRVREPTVIARLVILVQTSPEGPVFGNSQTSKVLWIVCRKRGLPINVKC